MIKAGKPERVSRKRRAVTINDVARRAGVSTATVSRALTIPEQVAETTRAKVIAAISETGYTPNASARNLRAQSTKIVLALLPGLGNSFWNVIINAVEEVLTRAGYGVIFGDTRNDPTREAHYDRLIRAGQVDGVLLFTGRLPLNGPVLAEMAIPMAMVCNDIPEVKGIPVFDVANRDSARTMVEYLISVGHRRIAHITGPDVNVEAGERLRGYVDALAAAGIVFDPDLVWPGAFTFVAGAKGAQRFLDTTDRPTAIFAASDEIAIGCIKMLKDAGVRVPEDVSVAGFDGIEYSAMYDPALTTMLQPRAELGRLAAENMVRRMAGEDEPAKRTRLACTLVVRESVAPAGDTADANRRAAASLTTAAFRRAEASR